MGRLAVVLDAILEDPEGMTGDRSVSKTYYFICGYRFAITTDPTNLIVDMFYEEFATWLARRWGLVPEGLHTGHSWHDVLLFAFPSEHRAFAALEELWPQYKAEMLEKDSG